MSQEASVLLSVFQTTCRRFCNQQKTAALNVVIMNTFSQNLPNFLQYPECNQPDQANPVN